MLKLKRQILSSLRTYRGSLSYTQKFSEALTEWAAGSLSTPDVCWKYIKEAGVRYKKSKWSKEPALSKTQPKVYWLQWHFPAWFVPLTSLYLGRLFKNWFYMYACCCLALVKQLQIYLRAFYTLSGKSCSPLTPKVRQSCQLNRGFIFVLSICMNSCWSLICWLCHQFLQCWEKLLRVHLMRRAQPPFSSDFAHVFAVVLVCISTEKTIPSFTWAG